MIKGKMAWIPSDVMTELYCEADHTQPVGERLREALGLPVPDPQPVVEKIGYLYDCTALGVGEAVTFPDATHSDISTDLKRQVKSTGRVFECNVTAVGVQVIRLK